MLLAELCARVGKRFPSRRMSQRSAAARRAKLWAKLRPAPHRNAFQRNFGYWRNTTAWIVRPPSEKLRCRAAMAALEYHRQDRPKLDSNTGELAGPLTAQPLNGSTSTAPNRPPYIRGLQRQRSDPAPESFARSPARSKRGALLGVVRGGHSFAKFLTVEELVKVIQLGFSSAAKIFSASEREASGRTV